VPIRYLAQELYRLSRRVEELEKTLAGLTQTTPAERARLEAELLKTRQERDHIRTVLESKKEKVVV
jgi:septal ring factor EnvC (AmiA/AmiB activator)